MKEISQAVEEGSLAALLLAKPELLRQTDSLGDLPLHAACSSRYPQLHSASVVEALAHAYPEALSTPNAHGMLPLHLACWFQSSQIMKQLVTLYPTALQTPDENGYLPLNFVIGKMAMGNEPWDAAVKDLFDLLLELSPDSLWQVDKQGVLPLQYACWNSNGGVGQRLLDLYLEKSPGGMSRLIGNDNGSAPQQHTPIHIAIASHTRLDILQRIHAADETALLIRDNHGRSPLHDVMPYKFVRHTKVASQSKLEWLLAMDPSAATVQDEQGKTPLHCLLENPSLFFRTDPPRRPHDGWPRLTQHLLSMSSTDATRQADRVEWMEFASSRLLSSASAALPDQNGNLPIHLAVQHHSQEGCLPELIQCLLESYPGGILATNQQGQTALQLAQQQEHCSLNTIFTLVLANPSSILQECSL